MKTVRVLDRWPIAVLRPVTNHILARRRFFFIAIVTRGFIFQRLLCAHGGHGPLNALRVYDFTRDEVYSKHFSDGEKRSGGHYTLNDPTFDVSAVESVPNRNSRGIIYTPFVDFRNQRARRTNVCTAVRQPHFCLS